MTATPTAPNYGLENLEISTLATIAREALPGSQLEAAALAELRRRNG